MLVAQEFRNLMARVRSGDQQAAQELAQKYEPLIRREVRLRLEDQRLRRVFDSMDVCQSVLASFFVRCSIGEYDLDDPSQLIRLLVTMTRNKVASAARKQHQNKRDLRRVVAGDDQTLELAASGEQTPSAIVAHGEILSRARAALNHEERQIAELRAAGETWEAIALRLGGSPGARRIQLARAAERVAQQLGLEPSDEA
jgi:RNA polymerase sigma factor (sigma-70 family)